MGEIAAIVLAAGTARRFGSDKLLHPLTLLGQTLPLAAHSLLPWIAIFGQVTVVVRPAATLFCNRIEAALAAIQPAAIQPAAIRWVECADAATGMAASLAAGIRANPDAAGWLVGLADMPAIPGTAIAAVRDALLAGAALAAPASNGRRGHPVGFAARYRDELLALRGDGGARQLLERDAGDIMTINISNGGIFTDIDRPGDLTELLTELDNAREGFSYGR